MVVPILLLALGFVLLIKGGDWFVYAPLVLHGGFTFRKF